MRKYALIGEHLSHTLSPTIYNELFSKFKVDAEYEIIEISKNDFDEKIDREIQLLNGFNVTIPYKETIIPHLKEISSDAKEIGAVNTVDTSLEGFNTDWQAFYESLKGVDLFGNSALVIGAGGASKAVCFALKKMNMKLYVKDRNPKRAFELQKLFAANSEEPDFKSVSIVINATPLGMYPDVETLPDVDIGKLDKKCVIYDLVYNPRMTKFLKRASDLGFRTIDGYNMLVRQASLNLKLWSMEELSDYLIKSIIQI